MLKRGALIVLISIFVLSFYVNAANPPVGTIFVTSDTFTSNLNEEAWGRDLISIIDFNQGNGVRSAIKLCQKYASDAGLEGTWISLLSDYTRGYNLITNLEFVIEDNGWLGENFYNMDEVRIAEGINSGNSKLFGNGINLLSAVNYNQNKNIVPQERRVWTGTSTSGMSDLNTCWTGGVQDGRSWVGYGGFGIIGNPHSTDSTWINTGNYQCSGNPSPKASLYCLKVGPVCGNDVAESNIIYEIDHGALYRGGIGEFSEECDGNDLNGASCSSEGFSTGELSCDNTCHFDTSQCTNCGNNNVDQGESCDGNKYKIGDQIITLNNPTCQAYGFSGGGNVQCNSCVTDTSQCNGGVFVTNNVYSSNLNIGAFEGAHEICRSEAANNNLGGWWKAWISTSAENSPKNFIKHSNTGYFLKDNTLIANNWNDLIDGSIQNAINRNAAGNIVQGGGQRGLVYTNTNPDGSIANAQYDCSNFMNAYENPQGASQSVIKGNINSVNSGWTNSGSYGCYSLGNDRSRLYCFSSVFDGDADSKDCLIASGKWLNNDNGCGSPINPDYGSKNCDTFHNWEGYEGGFCCGDDVNENYKRDLVSNNGVNDACCSNVNNCVVDGQCMSGFEGVNYAGTCSDGFDNDCDGATDNADNDCGGVTVLITQGNACSDENVNVRIKVSVPWNNVNWDDIRVRDEINGVQGFEEYEGCENIIDGGKSCLHDYDVDLDAGEYSHKTTMFRKVDNYWQGLLAVDSHSDFEVYGLDNENCCVLEGQIPSGGRICCDGLPEDGEGGSCGCPDGFEWTGEECLFERSVCYETPICSIRPPDNFVQWLATPGCFADIFRNAGQEQYEYACCPADFGDYGERGSFENPDALIEVY
jgi:hypothetical protein